MTIQITKKSVKLVQSKLYSITLNMLYLDGAIEILNLDFTCKYRTGENVNNIIAKFQSKMQAEIDNYKAEQVIYNAATLDTAIATLKGNLTP